MSACYIILYRNVAVAGVRCVGTGRKTWGECVKDDMKLLGLQAKWVVVSAGICGGVSYMGQTSNLNRW